MTETYVDQLVAALRMRDVPGDRIGEVIAEVEAYLSESGDLAADAFGPPDHYADTIAATLAARAPARAKRSSRAVGAGLATVVGAFLLTGGLVQLAAPGDGAIDLGWVIISAFGVSLAILTVEFVARGRRRFRGLQALAIVGQAAVLVFGGILMLGHIAMPWYAAIGAGAVLLAGAQTLSGWWLDRVIDPRTGRDRYAVPRWVLVVGGVVLLVPLAIAIAVRVSAG